MASKSKSKETAVPRPSASVLVISPTNQVLLLHRVRTSSSFPSAHVFPGGNCDDFHDGAIPGPNDPDRHVDGPAYRMAAIRETFEESGLVLARNNGFGRLIEVDETAREQGRRDVHGNKIPFAQWLSSKGGRADVEGLIPFTRWVTPTTVPKRFTTQMYIYFLPLPSSPTRPSGQDLTLPSQSEAIIPIPTHDGGVEHTAARFLPPSEWIAKQDKGEIILFPPQLFLLHLISQHLSPENEALDVGSDVLGERRQRLREFLKTGDPSWGEKCICPLQFMRRESDKRFVLSLEKPGPELKDSGRRGEKDRVVLVEFTREGPRRVAVAWRKDVLEEERRFKEKL